MNHDDQWHAERRTGIGGSDVAAILGLSPWTTPYQVWLQKLGRDTPQAETPAMRWGSRLEKVILDEYEERTGFTVYRGVDLVSQMRSAKHSYMIANLDGTTDCDSDPDGPRVVEAKTARTAAGWGDEGTDRIPTPYLLQAHHYLVVTGYRLCDVAVLIGGSDFRVYTVRADEQMRDILVAEEGRFWGLVGSRTPPDPLTVADCQARYGRLMEDRQVVATHDIATWVEALRAAKAAGKAADEAAEEAQAHIMAAMAEADELVDDRGRTLATWRLARGSTRLDATRLKAERPDVYWEFSKAVEGTRRFLLKGGDNE